MRILLNSTENQRVQSGGEKEKMASMIVLMNCFSLLSVCRVRIVHSAGIKGRMAIRVVQMQ